MEKLYSRTVRRWPGVNSGEIVYKIRTFDVLFVGYIPEIELKSSSPAHQIMAENNISNYMRWITPRAGDPTYSLLKAHLLFEELLNAYLARVLVHSSALRGARLTLSQTLAVARASSRHIEPDHWVWKAISDLNRIRNSLSHEAQPKDLPRKMDDYMAFVIANTKQPLPEPGTRVSEDGVPSSTQGHYFAAVDMATIDLYYTTASLLGFSISAVEQVGGRENAG